MFNGYFIFKKKSQDTRSTRKSNYSYMQYTLLEVIQGLEP